MNVARRARRATRLTQRAFAQLIGTDPRTVARWEAGHRRPSASARALLELIASLPELCLRVLSELPDPDEGAAVSRLPAPGRQPEARGWDAPRW